MAAGGTAAHAADEYIARGVRRHCERLGIACRHVLVIIDGEPRACAAGILPHNPAIWTPIGGVAPAGDVKIAFCVGDKRGRLAVPAGGELVGVHSAPGAAAVGALADHPLPNGASLVWSR